MRKIQNDELARLSVDDFKSALKKPFMFVLDNIRSMNNVGSIFRTADAFRCSGLILCGITSTPPHREIHKSALGAEESVDWIYEKNITTALQNLKSKDYILVALEQVESGIKLEKFQPAPEKKYAFILGNEIHGVSEDAIKMCDLFLEIPQQGTKHSLNVSVAAGILSWQFVSGSLR